MKFRTPCRREGHSDQKATQLRLVDRPAHGVLHSPPIRIRELVRIVVAVPIPVKIASGVAIRGDRINAQEPPHPRIIIALNTLTRRDLVPATVRSLDTARVCERLDP